MSRPAAGTDACSWARPPPRAAARSRWCSFPALRNGCSRKRSGKTHCCPTIGANAPIPRWRRSRAAPRMNDCSSRLRLAQPRSVCMCRFHASSSTNRASACRPSTSSTSSAPSRAAFRPRRASATARSQAGGSRLAWPAPLDPATAIDDFEHDLSMMGALLDQNAESVKGRARYLYELSPELKRSLSSRWLRWHRRQWDPADGIVRIDRHDPRRARRPTAGRAAVLADRAAAVCGVPVSIPDGGGVSAGAARSAGAAAEDGSADARRSVPSDASRRAAAFAVRRPVAALGGEPSSRAAAADDRDSRGSRSRVRPPQPRDRSRVAGRNHRHDAGSSRVARQARAKRASTGRRSDSSLPSACPTWRAATSTARPIPPSSTAGSGCAVRST